MYIRASKSLVKASARQEIAQTKHSTFSHCPTEGCVGAYFQTFVPMKVHTNLKNHIVKGYLIQPYQIVTDVIEVFYALNVKR